MEFSRVLLVITNVKWKRRSKKNKKGRKRGKAEVFYNIKRAHSVLNFTKHTPTFLCRYRYQYNDRKYQISHCSFSLVTFKVNNFLRKKKQIINKFLRLNWNFYSEILLILPFHFYSGALILISRWIKKRKIFLLFDFPLLFVIAEINVLMLIVNPSLPHGFIWSAIIYKTVNSVPVISDRHLEFWFKLKIFLTQNLQSNENEWKIIMYQPANYLQRSNVLFKSIKDCQEIQFHIAIKAGCSV